MNAKELAYALEAFRIKHGIHPDDFDNMFIHELIEKLEEEDAE
jgi:hypothetical protein